MTVHKDVGGFDLRDYSKDVYRGNPAVDLAALQYAQSVVGDFGAIKLMPGRTLTLNQPFVITRPLSIQSVNGGRTIVEATSGAFTVEAPDVRIERIVGRGPLNTGLNNGIVFVRGNNVERLDLIDLDATGFSSAVAVFGGRSVLVRNLRSRLAGIAGIQLNSVDHGEVQGGLIEDVTGDPTSNLAYGVTFSSLAGQPRSSNCNVRGTHARNIPWEGFDTHGGINIGFHDVIATDCLQGIVTTTVTGDGTPPESVSITGAKIDSRALGDQDRPGIIMSGDAARPGFNQTCVGCTVAGFRFGIQSRNSIGSVISSNTGIENRGAIARFRDLSRGGIAVGNVAVDPYGGFASDPGTTVQLDTTDPIVVSANHLVALGGAVATGAANFAVYTIGGIAGSQATASANDGSEAVNQPLDPNVTAVPGIV